MALPTYRGVPVLDWMPDADSPTDRIHWTQVKNRLATIAGPLRDDAPHQPRPRTDRRLRYVVGSRAELLDAKALIAETLQGRLKSFWVPSWVEDLTLAAAIADDDTTISVRGWHYGDFYSGEGLGREHIAIYAKTQGEPPTPLYRKITAAARHEDGTETLTLDSAPGIATDAATLVSFLHYVRCSDDKLVIEWESMQVGVLELPVIDIPKEAP